MSIDLRHSPTPCQRVATAKDHSCRHTHPSKGWRHGKTKRGRDYFGRARLAPNLTGVGLLMSRAHSPLVSRTVKSQFGIPSRLKSSHVRGPNRLPVVVSRSPLSVPDTRMTVTRFGTPLFVRAWTIVNEITDCFSVPRIGLAESCCVCCSNARIEGQLPVTTRAERRALYDRTRSLHLARRASLYAPQGSPRSAQEDDQRQTG